MKVLEKNNHIYFNYDDKSFANISKHHDNLKLELLETLPQFRNQHCATKLMKDILRYLHAKKYHMKIYLNPLPLNRFGLNLDKLISFYKQFGFKNSMEKDRSCPYLMERNLD